MGQMAKCRIRFIMEYMENKMRHHGIEAGIIDSRLCCVEVKKQS